MARTRRQCPCHHTGCTLPRPIHCTTRSGLSSEPIRVGKDLLIRLPLSTNQFHHTPGKVLRAVPRILDTKRREDLIQSSQYHQTI
jgi:hypothetical protein